MNMSSNLVFTILDTIDSTNNYAMKQIHEDLAHHGMAWFAKEQTAGKGQRGKNWQSNPEENILLSVAIQPPPVFIRHPFHLSALVALICSDFISQKICEKISIKWPNDLFIGDRKAGGILIENIYRRQDWKWAVMGIGININQPFFPNELKNPISLKQLTGKTFDTELLARELHWKLVQTIEHTTKLNEIMLRYNQVLYKRNAMIKFYREGVLHEEKLLTVDEMGKLHTDKNAYAFGSIEWHFD